MIHIIGLQDMLTTQIRVQSFKYQNKTQLNHTPFRNCLLKKSTFLFMSALGVPDSSSGFLQQPATKLLTLSAIWFHIYFSDNLTSVSSGPKCSSSKLTAIMNEKNIPQISLIQMSFDCHIALK